MSDNRYALLIANSKYPAEPSLQDLAFPANDVRGLEEVLTAKEVGGFREVCVLIDRPSQEIRIAANRILARARREDLVLIFFAGHGTLDKSGGLCLATIDTSRELLEATSVRIEDLKAYVDNASCRQIVLMLDCCHSGGAGKAFVRGEGVSETLQLTSESSGIVIMAASTRSQLAKEQDEHGVFSKHLIEGIKSGEADCNSDGFITADELYDYVEQQVRDDVGGSQKPMKWGLDVKGPSLVIAKSGKHPWEKTRLEGRKILLEGAKRNAIGDSLLQEALKILNKRPENLAAEEQSYHDLLKELVTEKLIFGEFVERWTELSIGRRGSGPGPEPQPELETDPAKMIRFGRIKQTSVKERVLKVRNSGTGELQWTYQASGDFFTCVRIKDGLRITIESPDKAGRCVGEVHIRSNGGDADIKVYADIQREREVPEEKTQKVEKQQSAATTDISDVSSGLQPKETLTSAIIQPGLWRIGYSWRPRFFGIQRIRTDEWVMEIKLLSDEAKSFEGFITGNWKGGTRVRRPVEADRTVGPPAGDQPTRLVGFRLISGNWSYDEGDGMLSLWNLAVDPAFKSALPRGLSDPLRLKIDQDPAEESDGDPFFVAGVGDPERKRSIYRLDFKGTVE